MKITKLGHCALALEHPSADSGQAVKILTDPGMFTVEAQESQTGLAAIVITHEHGDHYHVESVKKLLQTNPGVRVITNSAVAALLHQEGITAEVVGDGQSGEVNGVTIEGFGTKHAVVYGEFGQCENTGYMIANKFYFPGDNFHAPGKAVDVLALPVAGPWMKISEAIDFALAVKPRAAFGVHDGILKPTANFGSMMAQNVLGQSGVEYVILKDGESKEF